MDWPWAVGRRFLPDVLSTGQKPAQFVMNCLQRYSGFEKFAELVPAVPFIYTLKIDVIQVGRVTGVLARQGECFALIMAPWS